MNELQKLLDEGYKVTLQPGGLVDRERDEYPGYRASVRLRGGPQHTASGKTPELALWNAPPLRRDNERPPLPSLDVVIESALVDRDDSDSGWLIDVIRAVWREGFACGEMGCKEREKYDKKRRRLYEEFEAVVDRPHLRLA